MTKRYEFEVVPADSLPTEPALTKLQNMILIAFKEHGQMIDEELCGLPVFAEWKDSTIWKRRSELSEMGRLMMAGEKRNSRGRWMTIWMLP